MKRWVNRQKATEFLQIINQKTFCSNCGKQPIEWHRDGHEEKPNSRISSLRSQGASISRIQKELDFCTPLCRSCHMKVDGRLTKLKRNQPYKRGQIYITRLPCKKCSKLEKPLRRGMCYSCYEKERAIGFK